MHTVIIRTLSLYNYIRGLTVADHVTDHDGMAYSSYTKTIFFFTKKDVFLL